MQEIYDAPMPEPSEFAQKWARDVALSIQSSALGFNQLMEVLALRLDRALCDHEHGLTEKYNELREFVRLITLQLQAEITPGKSKELFQYAYRMYVKHDVES